MAMANESLESLSVNLSFYTPHANIRISWAVCFRRALSSHNLWFSTRKVTKSGNIAQEEKLAGSGIGLFRCFVLGAIGSISLRNVRLAAGSRAALVPTATR
jgi:hypothetical protein